MSDITKCYGTGCHKANSCYRFTATDHEYRQSYFVDVPILPIGSCGMFWDNGPLKIFKRRITERVAQQEYSATMSKDNNA